MHLYQGYADAVVHGSVPYRDFFMEYPPGALAVFLPPAVVGSAHYNAAFKALMALCGVVTLALVSFLLVRLGASAGRLWAAVLLLALSPAALGPISLNTYDAWPALLTLAALAALVLGWNLAAFALLGLAFAAKVYPVVVLPVALVFVWRSAGRRRALEGALAFVAVAAAVIVPFLALAPHGLAESLRAQAGRALQVESLGAALLATADHLGLYSASVVHRTGRAVSYDLSGSLPDALAAIGSFGQALAVGAATWLYARGRDDPRRLAYAWAASVAGFLAFTRFLSPQYLVWIVALVVLLAPAAWIVTAATLLLAQSWFFHYGSVVRLSGWTWLVLARDLLLVALFVLVLAGLRRRTPEDEHAVLLEHEPPVGIPP